jgi:cell division protein FtsB
MKIIRSNLFKYLLVALLFVLWICFFDDYNLGKQREMKSQLKALQSELKETEEKIKEYEQKNNMLATNKEVMEAVGRDNYYMKRDDEDLFIFLKEDEKGELVELE